MRLRRFIVVLIMLLLSNNGIIERLIMKKLKILFLCTGNSCRSQMAEGWAKHLKSDEVEAWSAGVEAKSIDSCAIRIMAEAGVDISTHRSKHVGDLMDIPFDYVVTLCGHAFETCPVFPGKTKKVHHGFEDPPALAKNSVSEEDALGHYRRVRDEIREFISRLPDSIESGD